MSPVAYGSLWLASYPGNPNGVVVAAVQGMLVVDTSTVPPVLWRARIAGTKTAWYVLATGGGGSVTDITSPDGTISVETGSTTPKIDVAKVPPSALVAGTNVTITTDSGKAEISSSGAGSGQSVPVVLHSNLTLAADTQTLYAIPLTLGSYRVIAGAGAYLVGV